MVASLSLILFSIFCNAGLMVMHFLRVSLSRKSLLFMKYNFARHRHLGSQLFSFRVWKILPCVLLAFKVLAEKSLLLG